MLLLSSNVWRRSSSVFTLFPFLFWLLALAWLVKVLSQKRVEKESQAPLCNFRRQHRFLLLYLFMTVFPMWVDFRVDPFPSDYFCFRLHFACLSVGYLLFLVFIAAWISFSSVFVSVVWEYGSFGGLLCCLWFVKEVSFS